MIDKKYEIIIFDVRSQLFLGHYIVIKRPEIFNNRRLEVWRLNKRVQNKLRIMFLFHSGAIITIEITFRFFPLL